MIAPRTPPNSFRDTLEVMLRHKRKMAFVFCLIVGGAAAATFLMPKTYRSEGKLLVRLGRENLAADPTATVGSTPLVAFQQSRESEINSVIEIITSRVLIEKVVDAVGPARLFGCAEDENDAVTRGEAIRLVKKSMSAEAVRKSNVIEVTYDAPSPELAQDVVNKLIEFFLDEYVRLNRTPGADEFLADQSIAISKQLEEKETELRNVKAETGLTSPLEQRTILVERIGRLQDELLTVSAALVSADEEVRKLREELAVLPATSVTQETAGIANEAADGMRQQLYALELREQDLSARLTPDHPQLQQVRDQIVEAKRVLESEEPERTQTTTGINKPHEEVQLQLLRQEPILAALRAKAELLETQLAAEQAAQAKLASDELRVARLEREVQLLESNYRKHIESLDQANVDQALADEGKSNISVVQPASFELKPVRPRVVLNLLLAVIVGALGAIAVAVGADSLDDTISSPEEAEAELELPVLAALPRFTSPQLASRPGGSDFQ